MEGTLLYWSDTPHYYYRDQLMILDSDESSNFRHSLIKRPSSSEVFGDKEVNHYVMTGNVEPIFNSTLPWDWEFQDQECHLARYLRPYTWLAFVQEWYSSTTESVSVGYFGTAITAVTPWQFTLSKDSHAHNIEKMRRVVSDDGSEKLLRRSGQSKEGFEKPSPFDDSQWDWSGDWFQVAEKKNGSWILPNWIGKTTVDFTLLHPVPYYWLDYMASIRPEINPTALSEVIRNAITEATTWNTNNYANLLEIIDLIKDFREGKIIELIENSKQFYQIIRDTVGDLSGKNLRTLARSSSKEAASAWLKYRYAYNTTKSDIESYAQAKMNDYFGALDPTRVLRGSISISGGTIRVKMRLHDKTTPNFEQFAIALNQYGLMPGLYNIWDMIPFSFVADWFTNLGDMLKDIDERIYFQYYQIDELLVTYKQELTKDEPWGQTYYKWYERRILDEWPQWEIYQDDESSTSLKTKVFRGLDSLSLAVGTLH